MPAAASAATEEGLVCSGDLLKSLVPERLQRLERHFQRLPIYFVTACTDQRRRLLNNDEVHTRFIVFAEQGEARGAWLGAYVLMPDHLHAFVVIDDERMTLSKWMKALKNTFSVVLRGKNIPSPHWQKGFFDHVLRSGESYQAKWHYVRENPVRAGLVSEWEAWPFGGEIVDLEFRDDRF